MSASTWEYADYITLSGKARVSRLKLHVIEVASALRDFTSRSGADGWSYSRQSLTDYYKLLKTELDACEPAPRRPTSAFIAMR